MTQTHILFSKLFFQRYHTNTHIFRYTNQKKIIRLLIILSERLIIFLNFVYNKSKIVCTDGFMNKHLCLKPQ